VDDPVQRFTTLYDRWYPRVLAYVLAHAAPQVAEDIVSETFLIAWRRLADVPEPALPWLLTVARHIRLKQRDGQQRQEALASRVAALSGEADEQAWDVAELVVERATALRVLRTLPADDLELLMLTVWQGLDAGGAAKVLGCSRAVVFVRLHRARRRLRQALSRAGAVADQGLLTHAAA
jgi:RNA polymerase sigma-70 factor (ECF subfamily)